MSSLLNFYQHLPEHINPIAVSVGSFSVRWYSIMYLVAFAAVYFLLSYRIRKKENLFEINKNQLANLLIYLIIGLLIGARLGYVLFYDFQYFLNNPLEIFWPFENSVYTGILGMSHFGGLIGVFIAGFIFSRKHKLSFWKLADFVIPAIPAGYFFGRIGNFLNGELYGRATDVAWGMYFPADSRGFLRHPSQFYEAFFEGLVLFLILWLLRNKKCHPELAEGSNLNKKSRFLGFADASLGMTKSGFLFVPYLFLYGLFRFFIEFFREPDEQIGLIFGWLTLGQIFSLILIFVSIFLYFQLRKKML